MTDPPNLPDALAADLAALADGRLPAQRRAELEARVAADPALAAALERQRTAVRAITAAAASVEAPHALRISIDALADQTRRARRARPRWLPFAGFAGAAAAVALALVVALGSADLTVQGALAAALRPPIAAASLDPIQPRLLRDEVEGVRFPNFEQKFGWQPAGARADTLDGRRTRTVFYEKGDTRLAYTIVGGDALDEPDEGAATTRDGVRLRSFAEDGRTVVTWRRQGHTCVLSGVGVTAGDLLELAAWKGQGAVAF